MKLTTFFTATALAALLTGGTARAQVLIVDDGASYTPPANAISNLQGYSSAYDGGHDFTDNIPVPGQTFTTVGAGLLSSITLQDQGSGNGFENATYALGIFSVSGTNLTYVGGGTYTFGGTAVPVADYFTLNLATPVAVSAATQYAFTLNVSSGGGYLGLDGGYSNNDSYAGGQAMVASFNTPRDPTSGGGTFTSGATPYDRNFSVAIDSVPEPSTWAMMILGALAMLGFARFRRSAI